jgi:tetratricopeptide (TPR) repeat protein
MHNRRFFRWRNVVGKSLIVSLAALSLMGCASTPNSADFAGLERLDSLGATAIDRGDWSLAERQLKAASGPGADDPALLVNLGKVYIETGRRNLAIASWEKALKSGSQYDVQLQDGSRARVDEVARRALQRYRYASR